MKRIKRIYHYQYFWPTVLYFVMVVGIFSGVGYVAYHTHSQPFREPRGVQNIYLPTSTGSTPSATKNPSSSSQDTAPSTTSAANPMSSTNNTARCGSILSAGETDLKSVSNQANQELADAKSLISSQGVVGGGLVSQSQTQQEAQSHEDKARQLTNQISSDRQKYISQLEALQCYPQAQTMLNYHP